MSEAETRHLASAGGLDASRLAWLAVQSVLRERSWRGAGAALATELASHLGCRRVSLGWKLGDAARVVALSHGAQVAEHPAVAGLAEAHQEAMSQAMTLCVPRVADGSVRITLAHRALMRREGLGAVLTVPLADGGEVLAALTCEREAGRFMPWEIIALEQVAAAVAPLLALKRQVELSTGERMRLAVKAWRRQLVDPTQGWRRALAAGLVVVLALFAVPMPHRLSAAARIEGSQQRVLSAPQDGYLRQVHVRPGDLVKAGQLLAEMSDEDLLWQQRSRQAELTQHENAFIDSFTRGDRAQAAISQAKAAEARAQLALVSQQLARTRMSAPFDGVVIAGDLSERLGAPVKRSEALFTLSPLEGWRVVLEVDERDVARVQPGQRARLLLSALPRQPMHLGVVRVTPVARTVDGAQRYEVLAELQHQPPAGLRPGLQGVAKIELASSPWGWRALQAAWRTMRWATWTWF